GTAITCSGPTTNMTDGEKRVVINSVDAGDDYTVFYSSYTFPTLQSLTSATCDTTPTVYRDTRDSQLYYVAKLADNKCWMLDNLKYKPNGDTTGTNQSGFSAVQVANTGAGNYLTQNGNSGTGNPNQDAAKYIDPIPQSYCYNNTDKPAHNITKCGLLYNYYTATAGTNLQANFDASNRNAAGSICPANWRLPSGYNADGDFGVLDKAYSGGTGVGRNLSNPDTQGLWLYSGAFASVYSGTYDSSFNDQGLTSFFLSSSAYNNLSAYSSGVSIPSWYVNPGAGTNARRYGIAVRCVIGL
ncbi:MAG: fibrobacter succinogenes major paralogous domain-containing protein, partial [Candidatus Nomurabacteria bacterium]|nr:fibrobacter succinogenes major paralogous domain-containing protein [Candidatus Nomurabacteria bacterium]